ncbi:MAG TPA: Rid family hydrolase [Bacteroidota bacterium]|nr:Rid family hydrolase [Bacteroidota bacterium]
MRPYRFFLFLMVLTFQVCFAQEKATPRTVINLPRPAGLAQVPFSDGVLVGNTLYISGRLGLDPKTGSVPVDVDEEIKLLLDAVGNVLAEARMSMDDLVSVQIFCTDLGLYDKFNKAYRERFKADFPARAFIGASALLRGAHFELLGVAVKG